MQLIVNTLGVPTKEQLPEDITPSGRYLADLVTTAYTSSPSLADVLSPLDPLAIDLISSLLCLDPRARPTAEVALRHPYFHDVPSNFPVAALEKTPLPTPFHFPYEHLEISTVDLMKLFLRDQVGSTTNGPPVRAAVGAVAVGAVTTMSSSHEKRDSATVLTSPAFSKSCAPTPEASGLAMPSTASSSKTFRSISYSHTSGRGVVLASSLRAVSYGQVVEFDEFTESDDDDDFAFY
jgi:serine/threonine protein kinase